MIVRSSLSGGVDGSDVTDGNKIEAYGKFKNVEETDIGILIGGESSATVALELIAIAEGRKDCVAMLSPEKADVVNNSGNEVDDVIDFRTLGQSVLELSHRGEVFENMLDESKKKPP